MNVQMNGCTNEYQNELMSVQSHLFSGETESARNSGQAELDAERVLVVLARLLHAGVGRLLLLVLHLEVILPQKKKNLSSATRHERVYSGRPNSKLKFFETKSNLN